MKISIVYFSKSGMTTETALQISSGISEVGNIDVKLFNLKDDQADLNELKESQAIIFGTPTYMANACIEVMQWFETMEHCGILVNKLGSAFATAAHQQGGAEIAINTLNNFMLVHGMLVYAGGGAMSGKPMTHLGAITLNDRPKINEEMAKAYGKRIALKVVELFSK